MRKLLRGTAWAVVSLLALVLFMAPLLVLPGCETPDHRIATTVDVIKQAQDQQAANTDRIWAAFIATYRAGEMVKINAFYEADVKKADGNKPNRANFATVDAYAEDLANYSSERTIFLQKTEAIRTRNIGKLDAKIAGAQATYDATKRNRESYNKLVQLLKDYENASIDPAAVAPILQQIITTFIPVDTIPTVKVVKPG